MPEPSRPWLRIVVPLALGLIGVGVFFAVLKNTKSASTPSAATPPSTAPASTPATPPAAPAQEAPKAAPAAPAADSPPPPGLHAQALADEPGAALSPIGSTDPASGQNLQIVFSPVGAGVGELNLASHFTRTDKAEHLRLQHELRRSYALAGGGTGEIVFVPFAAASVVVNGTRVEVSGYVYPKDAPPRLARIWRQTAPGAFEALIVDEREQPVLRLTRRYSVTPGSYVVRLDQSAENLTGQPLSVAWDQYGPVDLPRDKASYGGSKSRVRFGYQYRAEAQRNDPTVLSQNFLWTREGAEVMGPVSKATRVYEQDHLLWPNARSTSDGYRLSWAALTSQYFGVAAFPVTSDSNPDKTWGGAREVRRVLLDPSAKPEDQELALFLNGTPARIEPRASASFSMNFFAGPLDPRALKRDPATRDAGLTGLVAYTMGGPCGFCTFEIITGSLISLLRALHDYVLHDWALSIMFLVLVVRTILHPVTRWSQIRMQRFAKQMADMAPKQKKLQEKYGSDQQKLREEMGKLWREEGVNPAGMLGCIPMFLQTPVWIALFATLTFAIELRHQPAFFGVVQKLTGGSWNFLGDLAQPDHLVALPRSFHVPLMGEIGSINILPILLGIVFWIQQKYMTPPTTTQLTPEQEMQQKMMKYMMVLMFPLMMYNAPSGLALYFITNSTLGILESKWIRAHITKNDLLTPKKKPGGGGGGAGMGFLARLQALAEERQKQMLKAKGMPPQAKRRK